MPERTTFRDSALRAVAIIGLIAILVLGAWGIIQIVVGLPDFFSGFGGSSAPKTETAEHVTITAPAIVTSGQPFPLSWVHQGASGNYSFAFSYACMNGLSFAAPVPTGQYQQVPCNTPFNYTNATGNVQLIAVLADSATKQVNTSITVSATRLSDNKVTTVGSSTLTVLPAKSASNTQATQRANTGASQTTRPSSTYTPSGRTTNLYGAADLAVRILSAQPLDGRYSVQFEVSNVGTNVAPYGWDFTAQLPLNPPYTFVSQTQQKLYPGDRIVYTLGFDMPAYTQPYQYGYPNYYDNTFSVTVDPQNLIPEINKANNTASATLSY